MTPIERELLLATAQAVLANYTHTPINYVSWARLRDAVHAMKPTYLYDMHAVPPPGPFSTPVPPSLKEAPGGLPRA